MDSPLILTSSLEVKQLQFCSFVDWLLVKNAVLFQCNAAGCVGTVGGFLEKLCFIVADTVSCKVLVCLWRSFTNAACVMPMPLYFHGWVMGLSTLLNGG